VASVFDDFAQLHVETFDGVGGVNYTPDVRQETKERNHMLPSGAPASRGSGIFFTQIRLLKLLELL
jgi:hypothetical protein